MVAYSREGGVQNATRSDLREDTLDPTEEQEQRTTKQHRRTTYNQATQKINVQPSNTEDQRTTKQHRRSTYNQATQKNKEQQKSQRSRVTPNSYLVEETLEIVVVSETQSLVEQVHAFLEAEETAEANGGAVVALDPLGVEFDAHAAVGESGLKVVQSDVRSGAVRIESMLFSVQVDRLGVPLDRLMEFLGSEEFVSCVLGGESVLLHRERARNKPKVTTNMK
jgi:hypothetical protein